MLKKDRMVSCGAPGCTNGANKNFNIINSIICNNNVIITISWHIQNSDIFNSEAYSKTLSDIWDEAYWEPWHVGTAYSGLFWYLRDIQQYSAMVRHIEGYKAYSFLRYFHYWGMLSHIQTYSELCITLA